MGGQAVAAAGASAPQGNATRGYFRIAPVATDRTMRKQDLAKNRIVRYLHRMARNWRRGGTFPPGASDDAVIGMQNVTANGDNRREAEPSVTLRGCLTFFLRYFMVRLARVRSYGSVAAPAAARTRAPASSNRKRRRNLLKRLKMELGMARSASSPPRGARRLAATMHDQSSSLRASSGSMIGTPSRIG